MLLFLLPVACGDPDVADVWCPLFDATKSFEFLPWGLLPQTKGRSKSAGIAEDNIILWPWELALCCMGVTPKQS